MAHPIEATRQFVSGRLYNSRASSEPSGKVSLISTPPKIYERRAQRALEKSKRGKKISNKTPRKMGIRLGLESSVVAAAAGATGKAGYWAVEKAVNEWSNGNRTVAYLEATAILAPLAVKCVYRGGKKQLSKTAALVSERIAAGRIRRSDDKGDRLRGKHPDADVIFARKPDNEART